MNTSMTARRASRLLLMLFACVFLIACPAEETAFDRAKARDRIERLAVIDDTPWRVAGAYIRTTEPVSANSELPPWQQTAMADNLNFILRFDREKGIAYGYDGCQSFTLPLGNFRSEGSLSFDLSSLERDSCADSEQLESQRQFILDLLGQVKNVEVPLFQSNARDGQLQLKDNLVYGANLILEPANLSALDPGPEFGTALVTGERLQTTTLLSNDSSGLPQAQVHVFRNRAAFEYDWALRLNEGGDLQAIDDFDFTTHTLVAATSGQHATAGYRIEMNELQVVDGEIRIDIRLISPHPSCQVEPITTKPAAFYAIPSRSRNLRVSTVAQTGEPCESGATAAVRNLSINVLDDTTIRLSWDPMPGTAASYRVSAHSGQSVTTETNEATLQALAPGMAHKIVVEPQASQLENPDSVAAFVITRTPHEKRFNTLEIFTLPQLYTHELSSETSYIARTFSVDCGEHEAIGLDLSPGECALQRFGTGEPFTQWRTDTALDETNSIGYHLDRWGRLFISRHEGQVVVDGYWPIGTLSSVQCMNPRVEDGQFSCSD